MRSWSRFAVVVGLVAAAAVFGPGCSGEEGGTGGGTTSGTTSGTGTGGSGGGVVDCTPVNACEECAVMACADLKAKCCATPGCVTIIACGREHDCNGTDCYSPENCRQVIDDNGGPLGDAAAAAQPLGACAREHCPTCPGYMAGTGGGGTGGSGTGGGGTGGGTGGGGG